MSKEPNADGAMNLAVPRGHLKVISGQWASVHTAHPLLHQRSLEGGPQAAGAAGMHRSSGTGGESCTSGQVPLRSTGTHTWGLVGGCIFIWV